MQSIITKRKDIHQDIISTERKILLNNNDESVPLSSSPKTSKIRTSLKYKSTPIRNRSLSSRIFKCQLCCQNFTNKNSYLDHMIICAFKHQASIKI
ncbi:unnamed protein product, partial [Rotaria sordida]